MVFGLTILLLFPPMNQDQIFYMQEVLGISSVIVPCGHGISGAEAVLEVQAPQVLSVRVRGTLASAKLIAVWERARTSASALGEAEILVEKMVSAMKVTSTQVLWIDWDPSEGAVLPPEIFTLLAESGARPILVFGEHTARSLLPAPVLGRWLNANAGANRYMVTLSPEELLESTEKKRIAWAHLQTVMKEL